MTSTGILAIVLAAGRGTRLQNVTLGTIPKGLLTVGNNTLIGRHLSCLLEINSISLIHLEISADVPGWIDKVRAFIQAAHPTQEVILSSGRYRGTEATIRKVLEEHAELAQDAFVIYGDTVFARHTFEAFFRQVEPNIALAISCVAHDGVSTSGVDVEVFSEGATDYVESIQKREGRICNDRKTNVKKFGGFIYFSREMVRFVLSKTEFQPKNSLTGLVGTLVDIGVRCQAVEIPWAVNINTEGDLKLAQQQIAAEIKS